MQANILIGWICLRTKRIHCRYFDFIMCIYLENCMAFIIKNNIEMSIANLLCAHTKNERNKLNSTMIEILTTLL